MNDVLLSLLVLDFFGIGTMTTEVMFGLKIVALVMVYGYMHMNLGGGLLSTAVFLIFAYYFVFVAEGLLSIIVLALFFLMIHGFDILWGGDIVKQGIGQRAAAKQEMMHMGMRGGRMPPP